MRMLDAGCGEGRNLPYFIQNNFDVWGVDINPAALRLLQIQGRSWSKTFDAEKFIEADLVSLPFPPMCFDAIINCAVLHFAHDESHFLEMMTELNRVLRPGGSLFIRMASSATVDPPLKDAPSFRLTPPLVDRLITDYDLSWIEPMRTERVAGRTAQSTLVLRRN